MEQEPRTPRRLFSFDNVKSGRRSSSESAASAESAPSSSRKFGRGNPKRAPTLNQVSEESTQWLGNDLTSSPKSITPDPSYKQPPLPASTKPRPLPPVLTDTSSQNPTDDLPPPSPSVIRWDTLRQHVKKKDSSIPGESSSHTTTPSVTAPSSHGRTTPTPKSSRLASRFGLRNVVEQMQSQYATTSSSTHGHGIGHPSVPPNPLEEARRQFTIELQKACAAARYFEFGTSTHPYGLNFRGETSKTNHTNRTHNYTASGSALSLPFLSSTSLAQDAAQSQPVNAQTHARVTSEGGNHAGLKVMGSIKPLYQVLVQHAQLASATRLPITHLPIENQILSTLLMPFLRPGCGGDQEEQMRMDEGQEQWYALESFEVVMKTWNPPDELLAMERILWIIKAAAAPPAPPSYNPYNTVLQSNASSQQIHVRLRLLNTLWSLLVPTETFYPTTSPQVLVSVFHSLFGLQALLAGEVEVERKTKANFANYDGYNYAEVKSPHGHREREDARLLKDIIDQVRRGSSGELDEMRVEEEYNALFTDTSGRETDKVREAVELEGLSRALEFGFGGGSGKEEGGSKRWMLEWGVEEYWPPPVEGVEMTPLQTAIHARVLSNFTRASVWFLLSTSPSQNRNRNSRSVKDATLVVQALQTRVLPELESIELNSSGDGGRGGADGIEEAKRNVIKLVLEVGMIGWASSSTWSTAEEDVFNEDMNKRWARGNKEAVTLQQWASGIICGWFREGGKGRWKLCFENLFSDLHLPLVSSSAHPPCPGPFLTRRCKKVRCDIATPSLNTRVADDPPPLGLSLDSVGGYLSESTSTSPSPSPREASSPRTSPRMPNSRRTSSYFPPLSPNSIQSHPLTSVLTQISKLYPAIFYKPLFLCAAATKEYAVVNHLCTVVSMAKWVKGFWTGTGSPQSGGAEMDHSLLGDGTLKQSWPQARLGQSALIIELIATIQAARRVNEGSAPSSIVRGNGFAGYGEDVDVGSVAKFAVELEGRLGILIEAKEKKGTVPPIQRLLFSILFREIRLLTRSMKGTNWLPRFVGWFIQYHHLDSKTDREENGEDGTDDDLKSAFDEEILESASKLRELYHAAREGPGPVIVGTILFSSSGNDVQTTDNVKSHPNSVSGIFAERAVLLDALVKGFHARILKLLSLGVTLWEKHLDPDDLEKERAGKALSSVCFLFMQCAEKIPEEMVALMKADLCSSDSKKRLSAVEKITTLINWRFQIMSQNVVADRARRPFKVARGPLPFVATDMGSGHFVLEIDPNDFQDKLPAELRKKLTEIGWDDTDSPVNHQLEWVRTPLSLLPGTQIDKLNAHTTTPSDMPPSPNLSPMASPSRGSPLEEKAEEMALLRRNSSSGGPLSWMKRRAIWVPSLSQVFPMVAALAFDQDFEVSCSARSMIMDLMRNDPAMLTRPVWELLTGDRTDLSLAMTSLYALIHVRKTIPPAMAHTIFNSLAGFLKFTSKQTGEEALQKFARIAPVMATVVSQVSEMSVRELKRAKVDMFFVPSGSLWFPPSAPMGPMFPRGQGNLQNPFEVIPDIPDRLVSITMLRIAQNKLLLSMLMRNHAEVQVVRKNMARLVLPSLDAGPEALPIELKDLAPRKSQTEPASVREMKVRSLSILFARSHLLLVAQIFRSISRHLNDRNELAILVDGINRILLAHGNDIGIVAQSMIALMVASTRFRRLFASGGGYTLFMPVVFKIYAEAEAQPGIRAAIEYAIGRFFAYHQETFVFQSLDSISHALFLPNIDAEWIARNAYSLFASLRGVSPTGSDSAGIHDANKVQEREALMLITADEKPQTFLASLHRGGPAKARVDVILPQEYETKRLAMDDFVRMFLTVIAHDITLSRAQQFLRFLRFLIPSLYEASQSTRNVLTEGVDALGIILSRGQTKTKPSDGSASRADEESDIQNSLHSFPEKQSLEKSKSPSDPWVMRYDYLYAVVALTQAGGKLSADTSRNVLELVKSILVGSSGDPEGHIATILAKFTRASLIPKGGRSLKGVKNYLRDLSSIFDAFTVTVDWTGVLEVVKELAQNPNYNTDPAFCQLVTSQICGTGLNSCASVKDDLHRLSYRSGLVSLMTETVFLQGADILAELEKQPPQNDFLAWIVLPFALTMKTMSETERDKVNVDPRHRTLQARAWLRLLSYTISCCGKSQVSGEPSRPTGSSKTDEKSTQMSPLLMALQVIKVIIIRAEKDLTSCLPGVWERLGAFLMDILVDGTAEFGLRAQERSPSASPIPSPRASGQFDLSTPSMPKLSSSLVGRSYLRPRAVDYCLWSLLGLLCTYRSPLYLQIRAFMHEKVRILDEDLRYQEKNFALASPRSRRPSSSIFSKPRMSYSANVSPEASPRLIPLSKPPSPDPFRTSFQSLNSLPPVSPMQMEHPSSEMTNSSSGPRIVHLGLVSNQNRRSASPSATSMRSMAKTTKLRSMVLIRKTFLRVRLVQQSMGYSSRLLPIPTTSIDRTMQMDHMEEDVLTTKRTLTKWKALQEIIIETRELMAEFDESLHDLDDDMVIVDANQSAVL
ncbi:hypothetical protein D9758_008878 [Tetrapyrgos nigripes]|uniref:Protein UNC80 C-terminal domain-containing protein n=1 Tax=Tetrapyrgos nigripes TaxID=182062 RepID=A0A8H5CLN7_9AGAR|nr:hypothetical protein D9758_008878 [Tetrapyrgos nigripes]